MRRNRIGTLAMAAALAPASVGGIATIATAQTSPEQLQLMLDKHNELRQSVAAAETARLGQSVAIPDLTWNAEVAAIAQAWAEKLLETDSFRHNKNRGDLGENIYWESGFDAAKGAKRAFNSWADEQAAYTWDTDSCSDRCGHYTQIVWASTSSVGCGMATDGTQAYWVCDYAPPGNMQGERPYEPGAAVDFGTPAASSVPGAPAASMVPGAPLDPMTAILLAHNTVRQTVAAAETARLGAPVAIPDLTWNPDAAAVAQAWAGSMLASGAFEHNANRGDLGENIYWESGSDPATSADRVLGSWAAEQAQYTWDTNECSDVCGHYTQVVWASATSVGCGMATDGTQTYWVCDYPPPGNFNGERPYEPGVAPAPVESAAPAPVESTVPADVPAESVAPEPPVEAPAESPAA